MTAAHGTRDERSGTGQPAGIVEMPTLQIPCWLCTWVVVRPGPGMECISRLAYASSLCSYLSRHVAAAGRAR